MPFVFSAWRTDPTNGNRRLVAMDTCPFANLYASTHTTLCQHPHSHAPWEGVCTLHDTTAPPDACPLRGGAVKVWMNYVEPCEA